MDNYSSSKMPYPDHDIEMNSMAVVAKVQSLGHGSSNLAIHSRVVPGRSSGFVQQFVDSFRRDSTGSSTDYPNRRPGTSSAPGSGQDRRGPRYYDLGAANAKTAGSPLSRELKGRHLQMIAIGGSIGEWLKLGICAVWWNGQVDRS